MSYRVVYQQMREDNAGVEHVETEIVFRSGLDDHSRAFEIAKGMSEALGLKQLNSTAGHWITVFPTENDEHIFVAEEENPEVIHYEITEITRKRH